MNFANCDTELLNTVPLARVVTAAIIDAHEDLGEWEQRFYHWGARGLKKLVRETLHKTKRCILTVNHNTHTATLPLDFDKMVGLYQISQGQKIPLYMNEAIADLHADVIECEETCEHCGQDKSICNDLTITEEIELVVVNQNTSPPTIAQKTIVKKLYPNGDYFLEITTPVWNMAENKVDYVTQKEFIENLALKPCGCPENTPENIDKIKSAAPEVWCMHFTQCDKQCRVPSQAGFRVYEDTGLIQFDGSERFDHVYLEYNGFMIKKNGTYHVPEVAFETLVKWTVASWAEGKRNLPLSERKWHWDKYTIERASMDKVRGKFSLFLIMQMIDEPPKFDTPTIRAHHHHHHYNHRH